MDVTRVLCLSLNKPGIIAADNVSSIKSDLVIDSLNQKSLAAWIDLPIYELHEDIVHSINQTEVTCIGAYQNSTLVGYCFFCTSPVDSQHNSGGVGFKGIGLTFSDDIRYVYKMWVLPQYRCQQIASHIMRFAVSFFREHSTRYFVTTTEWTNTAFLRTARGVGFEVIGTAGEFVLLGSHYYLVSETTVDSDDNRSFVRLVKPG